MPGVIPEGSICFDLKLRDGMTVDKKRLVVVLGMHRSGTSAITRGIVALGARVGEDLVPHNFDNPTGFWEDKAFVGINDRVLAEIGQSYESMALFPKGLATDERVSDLSREAEDLIKEKQSTSSLWVIKDPRGCRLLSFWKPIFSRLGVNVVYVIAARHPLSVAESLKARNQFPTQKALLLWLEHYVASVTGTHGDPRIFVDYDSLLDNPQQELERLARGLGISKSHQTATGIDSFISEFFSNDLRHTRYSAEALSQAPDILTEISTAYELLQAASGDKVSASDPEFMESWNRIATSLETCSPILAFLQERDYAAVVTKLELESLRERLATDDRALTTAQQTVDKQESLISNLNQAVMERDSQITRLKKVLADRDVQIARLNEASTDKDTRIVILNQTHSQSEIQITRLTHMLRDRDRQIESILNTIDEQEQQIAKNPVFQGSELIGHLEVVETELKTILSSKSWRFTRPFRFIRRQLISRPHAALRRIVYDSARASWYRLPLSTEFKQKFKNQLFSRLPILFRKTQAYRSWRSFTGQSQYSAYSIDWSARTVEIPPEHQYVPLLKGRSLATKPAKLICFYLPQFHPIPENDDWWGEGFTEWTNVRPAQPQFAGHYQPHVPSELGYYDLVEPGVQSRQVELAKLYGIGGFCFYFYWFGGKRLLEAPIESYLKDSSLDLPFCLCWANENWSRRWDGLDSEILIAQEHSPEDDLAFIRHVARYLQDSRYIRIEGKPLLLVYRPSLLPSAKETAQRWRTWCRNEGIGEIYLAYTQSFETVDPAKYGFDAAIEFPPNNSSPPDVTESVTPLSDDFGCTVYDWRIFVQRSEKYEQPSYKLFRSVCPSWDNTARRRNRGAVFINNSPDLYRRWLKNAILESKRQSSHADERLIFVNAWNEWAEGAHLEPDEKYGYAWLQATRDALTQSTDRVQKRKIVLVSHDAHPHGAQYLALHLAQTLSSDFGFEVETILLEGGLLRDEFRSWGRVHDLSGVDPRGRKAQSLARELADDGFTAAIVNTTVCGLFLETLADAGLRCVSLIHELRGVIETNNLQAQASSIAKRAAMVVFPATTVAESFNGVAKLPADRQQIRPQGLYKKNVFNGDLARARRLLRQELMLKADAQIILGVGYADHRKGIDLFVEAGLEILKYNPRAYFVWVGHWDGVIQSTIERRVADTHQTERFLFVGRKSDTDMYYAGADVYALTSREDPFPSVVMESLEVGIPVVGFRGAGGFEALIDQGCGVLVQKEDVAGLASALAELLNDSGRAMALGNAGASLVQNEFSFRHYVFDLLDWAGLPLKRVSAVVPNYNYAHHLKQRLESITSQSYPIYELLVTDDASTDNSLEVIQHSLESCPIDYRVFINETNSGSVFKQWKKATDLARGDCLWICEADDFAAPAFIERAVEFFDDDGVVMAYAQSRQVGERGQLLADNYFEYTKDICAHKWRHDYVNDGLHELAYALSIKNSVPNVSGVLFRTENMRTVLNRCSGELARLSIAGDWLVYSELLKDGKVGYINDPLNSHRRHEKSVTMSSSSAATHLAEIVYMQDRVASIVDTDPTARNRANHYVKMLYGQFRLDKAYASNPIENPDVKRALESIYGSPDIRHASV